MENCQKNNPVIVWQTCASQTRGRLRAGGRDWGRMPPLPAGSSPGARPKTAALTAALFRSVTPWTIGGAAHRHCPGRGLRPPTIYPQLRLGIDLPLGFMCCLAAAHDGGSGFHPGEGLWVAPPARWHVDTHMRALLFFEDKKENAKEMQVRRDRACYAVGFSSRLTRIRNSSTVGFRPSGKSCCCLALAAGSVVFQAASIASCIAARIVAGVLPCFLGGFFCLGYLSPCGFIVGFQKGNSAVLVGNQSLALFFFCQ